MEIKCIDQKVTDDYAIYLGDSCEVIKAIPGDGIHFGVHSPPFEGLYKFSNSERDISNNDGQSFWDHYAYLIQETLPRDHARPSPRGTLHAIADQQDARWIYRDA